MTDQPILGAALDFAARGWPVFPCSAQNKRPLLAKDRDANGMPIPGTGGVSKATTDPAEIRRWWSKWPTAMIGVSVGRAGFFVLDFDPRHDAETGEVFTLERLKSETEAQIGCTLPATLGVRTPSGGVHLYFQMPEGDPITNRGNLPRHVDVRGLGGYVIAPPSICVGDGKNANGPYRWLRGAADAAIAEAPAALVETLRAKPNGDAAAPGGTPAQAPRALARPARLLPSATVDERVVKWARTAFDVELDELASTPIGGGRHGGRNQGIYWCAYNLGQIVAAGALAEDEVRAAIEAVVCAMPQNDDLTGALQTIDNGLTNGLAKPRDLSAVGQAPARSPSRSSHQGGFRPPAAAPGEAELARKCARYPLTDLGNVERFLARFGESFLYVAEWGWLAWDGQRWNRERAQSLVAQAVHKTVRAIADEADFVEWSGLQPGHVNTPAELAGAEREGGLDFVVEVKGGATVLWSDAIRKWAKAAQGAGHLSCIDKHAAPYLTAKPETFDADPFRVNLRNGTLHFVPPQGGDPAKAVLKPHDRRDLITRLGNVEYDVEARCPNYDRFLARVQPNETMRRFLHAWAGYNLTGDISAQKLVFFYGLGANGKSTWVDSVAFMFGDYGASAGIETFLDQGRGRKGGDATPDLASLAGRRMVRTSEPEKGAKWADALIKLVTGGEPLKVRELNMPFFEMAVSWKLTISGNHRPAIGTDHGIWRRMRLVPWSVTIPQEERDDRLTAKLKNEASGMLNRVVAGALDWLTGGLPEPEEVLEATAEYKQASDPLGRFIELCMRDARGQRVQSSHLFRLYEAWAKWAGEPAWKQKGFTSALLDRGYRKMQSNTVQWLDVAIVCSPDDFVDHEGNALETDLAPRVAEVDDDLP